MNSGEGRLLEGKVQEYSAGRHFIYVPGIKIIGIVISHKFIVDCKNASNGRCEFEIIQVQIDTEAHLVIIIIGSHSKLAIIIIIGIVLVT